ncbi:MAG TPA: hypothetical protein VN937_28840 [Blastocatellia bacterium]|nr:hypothetical protein [Blastocatellia bacterium]
MLPSLLPELAGKVNLIYIDASIAWAVVELELPILKKQVLAILGG